MSDEEQQELIDKALSGELIISQLDDEKFYCLLDGLHWMYTARIWNCIDPHGTMDKEWNALSCIFSRICRERASKTSNKEKT